MSVTGLRGVLKTGLGLLGVLLAVSGKATSLTFKKTDADDVVANSGALEGGIDDADVVEVDVLDLEEDTEVEETEEGKTKAGTLTGAARLLLMRRFTGVDVVDLVVEDLAGVEDGVEVYLVEICAFEVEVSALEGVGAPFVTLESKVGGLKENPVEGVGTDVEADEVEDASVGVVESEVLEEEVVLEVRDGKGRARPPYRTSRALLFLSL